MPLFLNKEKSIFLISILFAGHFSYSQRVDTVFVSTHMNTVISMPSKVLIVDPGSQDYAIKYMEDLVIMKAKTAASKPTSLLIKSVSEVNMWIIAYRDKPKELLVKFSPGQTTAFEQNTTVSTKSESVYSEHPKNIEQKKPEVTTRNITVPNQQKAKVQSVMRKNRTISDIGQKTGGIFFMLAGVYLDSDYIYFQLIMKNTSQISYHLDLLSFEHHYATKAMKRKQAVQNDVYVPEYFNSVDLVLPDKEEHMVYMLPIYAFNEKDIIKVKLSERGGERLILFEMNGKDILNAKRL